VLLALPLALAGCDDGNGSSNEDAGAMMDAGGFEDPFTGSCAHEPPVCQDLRVETACACVIEPDPNPDFSTNRVGCNQLMSSAGRERTPEKDECAEGDGNTPPELSCMTPGSLRTSGEPQQVTLFGVVDVFGNGGDASDIKVEVFEEGSEGSLGTKLGQATATVQDSPCSETEDRISNDTVVGTRSLGFYSMAGIPTETPLIVKTSGNPNFWKPLYTYNVVLKNGDVASGSPDAEACADTPEGPRARFRANILSSSDWTNIPNTAGLPQGIASGNGALAGEVRDCDGVRLEFAQVGISRSATVQTYFNDNPDNPLPVLSREFEGTSKLGLFAALDVPAGPVQVAALGHVNGKTVSLGWYQAKVFAGAVTVVNLEGLRAHQTGQLAQ
jgi:hypothetical protein